MMKRYSVIFFLLFFSSGLYAQLDSLQKELAHTTDDGRQYKILREIYNVYEEQNRDSALLYAEKGIAIARKSGRRIAEGGSMVKKGYQLITLGRLAEGLRCLLDAFAIADDPKLKTEDDWDFMSVPFNGNKKKLLKSYAHHIFGILMFRTENVQQQIFHFSEAARIGKEIGYATRELLGYMNLGQSYLSINKLDSSLYYEKLSVQLAYSTGYLKYAGIAEFFIGDIYKARGDNATALAYYYHSMQVSKAQNNQNALGRVYLRLLKHHFAAGNKDSALYYAHKNLLVTQSLGLVNGGETNLGLAYEWLWKTYELNHQPDSAYRYLKLALTSKDSLNNTRIKNLSDFQNLSFAEQVRLQNLEKEREQYQNKIWTYALLSGIGVVVLIAMILYRNNRQKNKTNSVLAQTLSNLQATQADLEVKNRELEIEAALEKIRSQSLAMHHSDELKKVIAVVFEKMKELDAVKGGVAIQLFDKKNMHSELWLMDSLHETPPKVILPFDEVLYKEDTYLKDCWNAKLNKENLINKKYSGELKTKYFNYVIANNTNHITPEVRNLLLNSTTHLATLIVEDHSALYADNWGDFDEEEPSEGLYDERQLDILKRVAKVFEQAYIRFLDLQKAEAQTRESQIELGLERVRARAMAMQKSYELKELIATVFVELTKLDLTLTRCSIMIYETGSNDSTWWMANSEALSDPIGLYVKNHNLAPYEAFLKAWKEGKNKWVYTLEGKDKKDWDDFLFSETGLSRLPDFVITGMKAPERVYLSSSFNNFGCLNLATLEQLSVEQFDILLRFAKVFDLTYTRFNDLQKAEAQAREAQIEAALEKIRSRSLAMHRSDELKEVIIEVLRKLQELGVAMENKSAIICLYQEGSKEFEQWVASPEHSSAHMVRATFFDSKIHNDIWHARNNGTDFYAKSYTVEEKNAMFQFFFDHPDLGSIPENEKNWLRERQYYELACAFEKHSAVMIANFTAELLDSGVHEILKRFGKVFEQAYIRFLDLQKAEAQAREAQIEASLERVRSRTLAMQKSDELAETAAEVFRQLIGLGIEPNRLYIGIIKGETGDMEMWATDEDGTQVGKKFMFNKNENDSVRKLYEGWATKQKSVIVNMEGKELEDYFHYLNHVMHIPFKGGLTQKRRVQSVAYFSKGFIGMASPDGQGEQTIQLLERFAAVFNLTFTRFNDLKIAEAHAEQAEQDLIQLKAEKKRTEDALNELQATQKQLIQSEKMASLGELTAGIAHEIQNPLNFVNNFSEVSTELVDEMNDEIKNGNLEDAQQIAADLKENLSKINHHGKRAGEIVRSMLQHSRSSSGQKELADINALCDEYLRLAYHGLRAKDKSFNAGFTTDFDSSIPKINIIPQDIGRVILNLINNAFYAVSARAKQVGDKNYQPTVTVVTKKTDQQISISIADNGTGMPPELVDKIFQPFFTTKPTGQGTGLGLSLSYDIVKAHGGELKIETREGEGSVFRILLPVNN